MPRDTRLHLRARMFNRDTCVRGRNHHTYNDVRWDAYFCSVCDEWLEEPCTDENCIYFCTIRPARPSHCAPDPRLPVVFMNSDSE